MTVRTPENPSRPNWLHEPLAIVGMACRLPGADGLDEFWQLLQSGGYAIDRLPESFFDRRLYFDARKGVRGKTYSDIGGLISPREIDWAQMPLTREQAANWDPCHLILCEVAAAACRHAGYAPAQMPTPNAGVYIGHSGGSTMGGELAYRTLLTDYVDLLEDVPAWRELAPALRSQLAPALLARLRSARPTRDAQGGPMVDAGYAAALISHALGLRGPHMVIDAACASSLVALALGAAALQAGQIDMAVVGGASYNKHDSLILFSQAQSCSATASRPFADSADGLISSEGYVVVLLKRLSDAVASGDSIQAIIRGVGLSTDGRGRSLWAPRKEGQQSAIERAYFGDVQPDSVQMIEAHATSTQVGDATEMEALAEFYREHLPPHARVPVGSVKSNIGHTLETAGLAGLVKTVLAIQHAQIPPSVNIDQLNRSIPWSELPLFVPQQCLPWPQPNAAPRRAAVNAFGIGGLNVHVVVDEFDFSSARRLIASSHLSKNESRLTMASADTNRVSPASVGAPVNEPHDLVPIAVVGRGIVAPRALDVASFARLLRDALPALVEPPSDRWRQPHTLNTNELERNRQSNSEFVRGGFITEFAYDWRKHKVPPKQIAQANPVQFMLLEAAEQALHEAGYLANSFDRAHTAVVVGSVFGGDFGNALFAGLRLPEFRQELMRLLSDQGVDAAIVQQLTDAYEAKFLNAHPALLDETGSFTSSTLASRLSKTFDLMGGAMAIDAGDASGLAALDAAVNLLRSGSATHVLCATGQRAMDRASFERLALHGRLCDGSTPPAEGVALVLLKPLSDALAQGDIVLATIHDVASSFDPNSQAQSVVAARDKLRLNNMASRLPPKFVGQVPEPTRLPASKRAQSSEAIERPACSTALKTIGDMQAAQGLVDIIECSIDASPAHRLHLITQTTYSGLAYCAAVEPGAPQPPQSSPASQRDMTSSAQGVAISSTNHMLASSATRAVTAPAPVISKSSSSDIPHTILRFAGASREELIAQVERLATAGWTQVLAESLSSFEPRAQWRGALVVTPEESSRKLSMLASQLGQSSAVAPLAEQGIFWRAPESSGAKIAWAFPGQGSQYADMLHALVDQDEEARAALIDANAGLASLKQPTFAELAWNQAAGLGEDVWQTQAAILVADYVLFRALQAQGLRANLVTGHSFGEFPAMLAAGCWNIETALRATWERCHAIVQHVPPGCSMLSIQAAPEIVDAHIARHALPISISHRNAPQQTVVGGKQAAVARMAQVLDDEGIVSRLLPVPTAFHTPALLAAQLPFERALANIAIDPPAVPLLSSVSNSYVADPREIRRGLVDQLVSPLDFVGLVGQLAVSGVRLVVEVGPQQVLSRLVRQIADDRLQVVSADHPKRAGVAQLLCVRAACEVLGPQTSAAHAGQVVGAGQNLATSTQLLRSPTEPAHFDATRARRERTREQALIATSTNNARTNAAPSVTPAHYDASQARRDRNRVGSQADLELATPLASSPTPTIPSSTSASITTRTSAPTASDEAAPEAGAAVASESSLARSIETFLIDFVVEQTGYPAEIIELDWDIEADLGIDSIKKAQLFGELREFFDLESLQNFSLDRYRTLRDIVNLLATTPGKGEWLERSTASATPHSLRNDSLRDNSASGTSSRENSFNEVVEHEVPERPDLVHDDLVGNERARDQSSRDNLVRAAVSFDDARADVATPNRPGKIAAAELQQFLIDFVVEQTGYPPEIVELDADLEADLGIDSIKKAQLFGELRELFHFESAGNGDGRVSLGEYRTLRSVLDLLIAGNASEVAHTNVDSDWTESTDSVLDNRNNGASERGLAAQAQSPDQAHLSEPRVSYTTNAEAEVAAPVVRTLKRLMPLSDSNLANAAGCDIDWSFALLASHGCQLSANFAQAVSANMRALAGSRERFAKTPPSSWEHLNGSAGRWQQLSIAMAGAAGTVDESVRAFSHSLLQHANWAPVQAALSKRSSDRESKSSGRWVPLLEFSPPDWLRESNGVPLACQIRQLPGAAGVQLDVLTPGSILPNVIISDRGWLLAGGLLADSANRATKAHGAADNDKSTSAIELSAWMHHIAEVCDSAEDLAQAARDNRFAFDWWLKIVDFDREQRWLLEGRERAMLIERSDWHTVSQRPELGGACGTIYFDALQRELVLQAQLRQPPFAASELCLPIASLNEWSQRILGLTGLGQSPEHYERPDQLELRDQHEALSERDSFGQLNIDVAEREGGFATRTESGFSHEASLELTGVQNAELNTADDVAKRFVLRMVPSPRRDVALRLPTWSGAALVIGDNPVATQLEARLRGAGVSVTRWAGTDDPTELASRLKELWQREPVRHLFLTTPCDADATTTLDERAWQRRRQRGLMSSYWLCQRWHQLLCETGWVDDASLVAVTSLGGEFGLNGAVRSVEGGGLAGLLKSILIESWVQGFRTFPIKVLDTQATQSPGEIVEEIWRELAIPSFDVEVSTIQGVRHVVRAIARPTTSVQRSLTRSGTWVCTGGARGITAYVAEAIARRYGATLHLLGTAASPNINPQWRSLDDSGTRSLKAQVMTEARAAGRNPVTTWQDTEKLIEIDATLRRLKSLGIQAYYHQCDVSNRDQVRQTLERVRQISGPIHGVLHGAGVGKDARFDRKQAEKVNQCIAAKVDGAWALMEATWHDPLDAFIGFGSISGRFGANGHTDYSLANDMLCKQMDWLRSQRPDVHAVGFHWHAWGDIGMATKPETRLALEMIDMQFMPAAEGLRHFFRELEGPDSDSEVLITDDRYYRLFYSPEAVVTGTARSPQATPPATPLLTGETTRSPAGDRRAYSACLKPAKDPFLVEHRLDDQPFLPIVVGAELLLEGARAHFGHDLPLKLVDLRAVQGLKVFTDQPQTVKVETELRDSNAIAVRLLSDFHARDGRLVQRDRVNLSATVCVASQKIESATRLRLPAGVQFQRPQYPPRGSKFHVGPALQRLRGFAITDEGIVGRITAPALIELAGGSREVRGWQIPSSALDACLFAAGIFAWQLVPGSALPARFGEIALGRQPSPGEACEVHVRLRNQVAGQAAFDFTLFGVDGDVLVNVREYEIAWLREDSPAAATALVQPVADR